MASELDTVGQLLATKLVGQYGHIKFLDKEEMDSTYAIILPDSFKYVKDTRCPHYELGYLIKVTSKQQDYTQQLEKAEEIIRIAAEDSKIVNGNDIYEIQSIQINQLIAWDKIENQKIIYTDMIAVLEKR